MALTSSQIEQMIRNEAISQGLDPNLAVAIAKTESSLNPNAVSNAGAQGIFQLMPATAASVGVTNPFDPSQNISGGITYFNQLLQQYNGDTTLALAAYNAGPGAVSKYGGVPPYQQTQDYITKVNKWLGLSTPTVDTSTSVMDTGTGYTPTDITGTDTTSTDVLQAGIIPTDNNTLIALVIGAAIILAVVSLSGRGGTEYD